MRKSPVNFLFIAFLFFAWWNAGAPAPIEEARGLWIECEGSAETLSSRKKIDQAISVAAASGLNMLFVQVYRHDRAWFNTRLADPTPYREFVRREKIDPLAYLIQKAHRSGLQVHAWMNMFRIGKDKNVPVLERFGDSAVTRDGKGRSLIHYKTEALPDGGYWLDPGDQRVRTYLLSVIAELIRQYPALDGIHLDFIRYPYTSAYAGSLWAQRGDLGYGTESVRRFKEWTGDDPLKMELNREKCQAWDDWRRHQIDSFVSEVYRLAKKLQPKLQVSAAALAWAERAYLSSFQDWRRWLEEGTVDFVAIMNYSTDLRFFRYLTWSAMAPPRGRPIFIGLGAYLLVDRPDLLLEEISICRRVGTPGIAFFSYDAMLKSPKIFKSIKQKFFSRPSIVPRMVWK